MIECKSYKIYTSFISDIVQTLIKDIYRNKPTLTLNEIIMKSIGKTYINSYYIKSYIYKKLKSKK